MITIDDVIHTIEDRNKADIIRIIGSYLVEIKSERPDLLQYELNELHKRIAKAYDFYQRMRENPEHIEFVKAQRPYPNYTWGEDVKRYVKNYKVALDILTSLKPTTQRAEAEKQHDDTNKGNAEPTKEQQVKTILQPLFNDSGELQFNSLVEHITADKRPVYISKIPFTGTKTVLYKKLAKLIDLGYTRQHLASVFSELCSLDYEILYKKISK